MKNKKSLFVALAIALTLSFCATLGIFIDGLRAQGNDFPTLSGGEIEEVYLLGDVIEIPESKITYGGETKDAEISVIKPNGEKIRNSNVKLTEGGIYKAEYKALFNGKAKTVEKTFTVQIPLFSATSPKTSWEYGVDDSDYQTGKEGVKVRLAKGDTLTYNDIIDLKKNDGHVIDFFLLPGSGAGTKDLKKITIRLTDLHDPNVVLTIILQCANDHGDGTNWWYDWTYVLAGGQNQTPTGIEGKGTSSQIVHVGDDWGAVARYSFYGMHTYSSGSVVGTESLSVTYNDYENAVYVGDTEIVNLSDLKFFEDPWMGFKTGEVKMSITGDGYSLGIANLMITRIGTNNLKEKFFTDKVAPEIEVDFGDYDQNDLPTAGKGYSYPVFSATANDKVFGDVDVKATVYHNYESAQRYQVDIKDGRFATDSTGYYTIEYLAYDNFKNEAKKLVTVKCDALSPEITAEAVGDYATEAGTGELVFPAEIKYTGGTGIVKTYATAKAQTDSEEIVIDEGFRPEKAEVYKIKLYAVDTIGKTAVFEYDLDVSVNDKPVFLDSPILPRFFLEGYKYNLPTISAYDYSSGSKVEKIETTIAIKDGKDGGKERDLDSNVADFDGDEEGYATVIYKATGKKGSSSVEYKVKVIDTWREYDISLDMKKYFYGEDIEITDDDNGIRISSTKDCSYTFVNPVIAHRFETKFLITSGEFETLQLVFEDSIDSNIGFSIEIDNSHSDTENAQLRINGTAIRYRPWAGFDGQRDFYFMYDQLNKILQDDASLKSPITNVDGSEFNGFPSGLVYVKMNVIGVDGKAEISWGNFGGQILSNSDYDYIAPSILLSKDYDSKYSIGTVAEIYSAIAADVLSPEVYTSMTVKDPNGEVVTDVDGLRLENVPFDRSYFINLEMYGSYSVKYSATDFLNRQQEYPFAILVIDDQAPEITLSGEVKTEVKQGKKLKINKATAKDNVDEKVTTYVYLVDPNGIISKVTQGEKVKLTQKGVYELRYMAIDESGNLNIVSYEITVV